MTDRPTPPQPRQQQAHQPGREAAMSPRPQSFMEGWVGSGQLKGQAAIVAGGDSGIGRAVAIGFAKEGTDVVILHKEEHHDAEETLRHIRATGRSRSRSRRIPGWASGHPGQQRGRAVPLFRLRRN